MLGDDIPSGQISPTPLRKANTRGSVHITGTVFSRKMGYGIDRIGPHELRFLIRAEIDPRISRILYQPVRYSIPSDDGTVTSAFPDFLIEVDGVAEIHEVKPDDQFDRPDVRRRLELTARAAARHGHRYSVSLAGELHRKRDRLAIDAVWRRIGESVDPLLLHAANDLLKQTPRTIGEAIRALAHHGATIHDFHRMLAAGHLIADMMTRPDESMVVHHRLSEAAFDRLIPFNDPLEGCQ